MSKVIFLFNKNKYTSQQANGMTLMECERMASSSTYDLNDDFVKIDAEDYDSIADALDDNGFSMDDGWYIRAFGFTDETKQKVYVVLYHAEWESYSASSEVIGVYTKHEDAEKAMREEIENAKQNSWTCDMEDTEVTEETDSISLFDNLGNIDYVVVSIIEKEVD